MGIKLGICGTGAFAGSFIPLFQAHPQVDEITLCDLDAEKRKARARQFGIPKTCPSLDELLQTGVDAVAIFTQNWLHGPQAVRALQASKHVYSAVPSAITMEEITELVRAVERTGLHYMVGETSYYYPCALYCRKRFRQGDFGKIVYGEGEYYHDWDHGLYDVMKWRGGKDWKRFAGSPPMHYPTHSTGMIVSVTGARMTHVSCLGFEDRHEDGLYRPGVNRWDNPFSNQTALFRMSDGSVARINEFRRIGHPGTVRLSLHGTEASYEEQTNAKAWVTKNRAETLDLTQQLKCKEVPKDAREGGMAKVNAADGTHAGYSSVHPMERLPAELRAIRCGHNGSHAFLVDDFVKACDGGPRPPNNVWEAARYLVPGLIAHESAKQGGKLLEVPDFGDPPA